MTVELAPSEDIPRQYGRLPKPAQDCLTLCEYAAERLRRAGFELRYVSRQSEARYFGWPGRTDTIRLAVHTQKHSPLGLPGRVVAKITFKGSSVISRPGEMRATQATVDKFIEFAVGRYIMLEDAQ